nr:ABC transporter substrate-binding protein [Anaerolineae bacterium]
MRNPTCKPLVCLLLIVFILATAGCTQIVTEETTIPLPIDEPTEDSTEGLTEEPSPELAAPEVNFTGGCVEEYVEGFDYFPEKTSFDYAQGVTVEYFDNYKVVEVLTPWQFAEETITYVLVQCGTPVPEDVDGMVIEVPVSTVISMSTTFLPALDGLGLIDQIVGLDSFAYPYNPAVLERAASGDLVEIGSGSLVNVEAALEADPSLIFTTGSGIPDYDAHPTLIEAGLPVAIVGDWVEGTPLARAEWIKYIGLFYNLEQEASRIFDEIATDYNGVLELVSGIEEKPTVFANTPWEGTWYMPGGAGYMAQLFADAGAEYMWANNAETGSLYLDFETVFDVAQAADIWVNVNFSDLVSMLAVDERFGDFAAFQNGEVYALNARVNENFANDYFESGAAHPEIVLMDLVRIFHPDLLPDYELYFYQQLQ